ncbi:non-ribosomal peptide synthetase [Methylocystis sp. SC2]|uniref:non-ribosomal peptide synthetase n=1 Tax=Methylocystis sp. (strain SC2) TaxID=187303 RepID=UPI00027AEDB5|nr:non-ribosomal peptide synthetase [Methylocystis sp. SC2]CCJ08167.1 Dimodular nonribosomal peptide synthase [Methylocystis sp. SC2]
MLLAPPLRPSSPIALELPLIAAQPGIWMGDQVSPTRNAFIVAQYVELKGVVDVDSFRAAIRIGLSEADTVHARFIESEGRLSQIIPQRRNAGESPDPDVVDVSEEPDPEAAALASMRADLAADLPLDGDASLYRHALIRLGETLNGERWFWYQRYHHLMVDGFSFAAIARRIADIYTALRRRTPFGDSPFTSFAEVVEEYQSYEGSKAQEADRSFWQDHAQNLPTPIALSPPSARTPQAGAVSLPLRRRISLPPDVMTAMETQGAVVRVSGVEMAMAAVFVYLHRMSGATRLTVGMPFMRRMGSIALFAAGPVVNVLPVQLSVEPSMLLSEAATALALELRAVRRRQRYEAEQLRRDLGLVGSDRSLYGPMLNLKMFDYRLDFDGVAGVTHQLASGPVEDMEVDLYVDDGRLTIDLVANCDRYDKQDLELHAKRLACLVERLAEDPKLRIGAAPLLTEGERALIAAANDTAKDVPPLTLCDMLAAQAARTPDAIALLDADHRFTYREVRRQVSRLAHMLADAGVVAEDHVAVALPRSVHLSLAIMAALETGAAYLPLDINYPDERLAYMVEDAAPRLIITSETLRSRFEKMGPVLIFDELASGVEEHSFAPKTALTPGHPAYIIYTSGSTGKPKGVVVSHGAVVNLLYWLQDEYSLSADDVVLQKTPCSFDVSVGEFFWPLTCGARLVMAPEDVDRDPESLLHVIRDYRVTTMNFVPSLLAAFVAGVRASANAACDAMSLHAVFCIGEALSKELAEAFENLFHAPLHNVYGPTEATVEVTYQPAFGQALASARGPGVPIGRPLWNTGLRILDARLRPAPIGVAGDLYLTGAQLAQGYWRRASLTASRFVADPEANGERMYRTGDIARWLPDGTVDYLGRSDDQLKIRGQRIELGEIESALRDQPGVGQAAVIARILGCGNAPALASDARQLIGYVTPATLGDELDGEALRAALGKRLPAYMTPVAIVVLREFPLSANGKLDRKALPDPSESAQSKSRQPLPGPEAMLAELIADVLRVDRVGADDDFFFLGGDSISAIGLCAALRRRGALLRPRDIFECRSVARMAQALDSRAPAPTVATLDSNQISDAELDALRERYGPIAAVLPALPLQEGLLFHARLGEQASRYNAISRFDIAGPLDVERLKDALETLLRRHPQLAAVFDVQRGAALQILPLLDENSRLRNWPWKLCKLDACDEERQVAELDRLERAELDRDFLGAEAQERMMAQATLVRLAADRHVLLICSHHLIGDGWSSTIMLRELLGAYAGHALPPLTPDYQTVVRRLTSRDPDPARFAWREALQGVAPTVLFEETKRFGAIYELSLRFRPGLIEQLEALRRSRGLTLNTLMQGVWGAFLATMTGRSDVVFGSPMSGRSEAIEGVEAHIGLFTNTLPVRLQLCPDQPLLEQLVDVQQRQIRLLEHDGVGLGEIQRLCDVPNLFDTLLVVENYPEDANLFAADFGGLRCVGARNRGYTHYPLTLMVLPGRELELRLEYREGVEEPERIARRVTRLLEQIVDRPDAPLSAMDVLLPEERDLLARVNTTKAANHPSTLCELLADQAQCTPDAIALVDADHALSYREVRRQVTALARIFVGAGVATGDIVAIALPRSVRLVIALMAAQEAGAAYLPLDTSYPEERLTHMVQDARPRLIVTTQELQDRFERLGASLVYEELLDGPNEDSLKSVIRSSPDDAAYVIYTSGSTGRPKGVTVSHKAIVNRLRWMQHEYRLSADDVVLQKTPSSFDVSVWEFFWPLMTGARLVVAPPDAHRDPRELLRLIQEHRVSVIHFVPSMLATFVATAKSESGHAADSSSLRLVFCSGEALSKELTRSYGTSFGAPLHNLYGPTEAAVDVTYQQACGVGADDAAEAASVPIGRPVWNTALRVLDGWLRPTPIGVAGELYLSGVQLADGYLGRPSLTASRFVADPFADGERMYRTGDIVRWLGNGTVEYLGRGDDQIKIRGQRIELGEIESVLLEQPDVAQAAVLARATGERVGGGADERQLIGYVVPSKNMELDGEALRRALVRRLPGHMIPTAVICMKEFPLNASGKLDRKALPAPGSALHRQGRKPLPGIETTLSEIFARVLGVDGVNADDDFFALGGHSLLAMQLAAALETEFKTPVSVGEVIVNSSVERLARALFEEQAGEERKAGFGEVLHLRSGAGAPLICIHPASGFSWQFSVLTRYLQSDCPVIGLQSPRPNGVIAVSDTMDEVCKKHLETIRSIQPHGPYRLLGYSLGGVVAQAIAARLVEEGDAVEFLGLLDTYPPEIQDWSRPPTEDEEKEIEKERALFMNASKDALDSALAKEKVEMFGNIMRNYEDSVRLLSTAKTARYSGPATLFVARRTLPAGMDVQETWRPYVGQLNVVDLDCAHTDIVSPRSLQALGPILNSLLRDSEARS